MNLRLDPWGAEYNTAFHAEDLADEARATVNAGVEYANWRPVTPGPTDLAYDTLLFTDGSRRLEARVLLEDDERQLAFGALGSYGIGVVDCCPRGSRRASFLPDAARQSSVTRICALGSGHRVEHFSIVSRLEHHLGELHYRVVPTDERDADAVVRKLQYEMLNAERDLAARLVTGHPNALVICDGPRPRVTDVPNVIGYVKTLHTVPLDEEQVAVLRGLEQGQRSPIYLVQNKRDVLNTFEWFLRLRDPRPWLYSLAGMVKLQAYAGSNPAARLAETVRLADWLCLNLPRFASRQHQDPRAPQQLLPVRALETELKRRMGSGEIIRRRITAYLSQGA